jgi:hypothetical protein
MLQNVTTDFLSADISQNRVNCYTVTLLLYSDISICPIFCSILSSYIFQRLPPEIPHELVFFPWRKPATPEDSVLPHLHLHFHIRMVRGLALERVTTIIKMDWQIFQIAKIVRPPNQIFYPFYNLLEHQLK